MTTTFPGTVDPGLAAGVRREGLSPRDAAPRGIHGERQLGAGTSPRYVPSVPAPGAVTSLRVAQPSSEHLPRAQEAAGSNPAPQTRDPGSSPGRAPEHVERRGEPSRDGSPSSGISPNRWAVPCPWCGRAFSTDRVLNHMLQVEGCGEPPILARLRAMEER